MPGLWTMTIACGVAPWMSPSVTELYAGWSRLPWPSTMTQSPRRSPSSTSHSPVPWTKSAMTRSTATPQPSIIIPVWPVATNDAPQAGRRGGPPELEGDRHLADGAVRADGEDHPLARRVAAADGRLEAVGRPAVVDDPDARAPGRGRRTRGRRRGTCAARSGCRARTGSRRGSRPASRRGAVPPVGAIPMSRPLARGRNPSASLRLATIGMSKRPESPSHSRTLRPACVESMHGHDPVGPEPDDAHRGLAVVEAEVALGEDHEPAIGG